MIDPDEITAEIFEDYVSQAIDSLDDEVLNNLKNVAIVTDDMPSPLQLKKGGVRRGWLLFGLYEGVPRTARGNNYSGVLPDKITIFRMPILAVAQDHEDLRLRIKNTVWHEIAHHYGLGHGRIRELERKSKNDKS